MNQEHKDLLLKELCARLPYEVKFKYKYIDGLFREKYGTSTLTGVRSPYHIEHHTLCGNEYLQIEKDEVKLYLFPLSSMTEDQKYEFYLKFFANDCDFDYFKFYLDNGKWHKLLTSLLAVEEIIDWFHKNHIDYRGLIPIGLAIDATELINIY